MKELGFACKQIGASTAEWFTYALIVIVCASTAYGFYFNYKLENVIAEAVASGEAKKAQVEQFFEREGRMPQTADDAGTEGFIPVGVLKGFSWEAGAFGEPGSDTQLNGTIKALVDLTEFGERFEETESAYLLIARGQEDGTIIWDCKEDTVTINALSRRYLPDTCRVESEPGEEE